MGEKKGEKKKANQAAGGKKREDRWEMRKEWHIVMRSLLFGGLSDLMAAEIASPRGIRRFTCRAVSKCRAGFLRSVNKVHKDTMRMSVVSWLIEVVLSGLEKTQGSETKIRRLLSLTASYTATLLSTELRRDKK